MSGIFEPPDFFPADFPREGARYVVSSPVGIIGPWDDRSNAVSWARCHMPAGGWAVEELIRPEDIEGGQIDNPGEADEEPMLPGLEV